MLYQSCLTLYNPMDCSPPGASLQGISQARILEWVATASSRGSSRPRDRTHISCTAGGFFTTEPPGKPQGNAIQPLKKNKIMPSAATWMPLEIITLSELSQRKTNTIYHLYVESKIWHKRTYPQREAG